MKFKCQNIKYNILCLALIAKTFATHYNAGIL